MTIDTAALMTRYENAALELTFNSIDLKSATPSLSVTERLTSAELARIVTLFSMHQLETDSSSLPELIKTHLTSTGLIPKNEYTEYDNRNIKELIHRLYYARIELRLIITRHRLNNH